MGDMWEFHPRPQTKPITVREAIGHLIGRQAGRQAVSVTNRR